MTRRQLGDALRILLRKSHFDMEEAAVGLVRMHASAAEIATYDGTDHGRCLSVITDVAVEHGVTIAEIKASSGRAADVVMFRREAAWRCRQLRPTPSYPTIARALGLKNHTSVLHAVRRYEEQIAKSASTVPSTTAAGDAGDM